MTFAQDMATRFQNFKNTIKERSHTLMIVNAGTLTAFSLVVISIGAFVASSFSTSNEASLMIGLLVGGGILLASAIMLIVSICVKKPDLIFVFAVFTTGLVASEIALGSLFVAYTNRLLVLSEAPKNVISSGQYETASDFVNSMWIECCAGCSLADCGREIASEFCDPDECSKVPLCNSAADTPTTAACFYGKAEDGTLPPRSTSQMCGLLERASWSAEQVPVVGNIGGSGLSCGGSDVKVFQLAFRSWLRNQYKWFASLVAVLCITQLWSVFVSIAYRRWLIENPGIEYDKNRPFAVATTTQPSSRRDKNKRKKDGQLKF